MPYQAGGHTWPTPAPGVLPAGCTVAWVGAVCHISTWAGTYTAQGTDTTGWVVLPPGGSDSSATVCDTYAEAVEHVADVLDLLAEDEH